MSVRRERRSVDVTAPDGRVWVVRRRFRRPRWLRLWPRLAPVDLRRPLALALELHAVYLTLLVWFAVVLAAIIGLVLLGGLVRYIALAVASGLAVVPFAGRWGVEAVTEGPPPEERLLLVRGLRRSRRALREVADGIARGHPEAGR